MSDSTQESAIIISDLEGVSELRAVETLQKEVWGCADLDVAPLTMFVATREVGAVLIGAYDGPELVGLCMGFQVMRMGTRSIIRTCSRSALHIETINSGSN